MRWDENGREVEADFLSLRGRDEPRRTAAVDDTLTADAAFRLVSQGTALIYRGDFRTGRQLLAAIGRRIDGRLKAVSDPTRPDASFHSWRQTQAQRASMLSLLLVPVQHGAVSGAHAPNLGDAWTDALGGAPANAVMPLRDILTLAGVAEWQRKGVPVPALGTSVHPRFGVFPPTRQDYIDLVAGTPLPRVEVAFDLGTGSGVLAAVLLRRGVPRVVATEVSAPAIASARDLFVQLGCEQRAEIVAGHLWPEGRAGLVVCNPPWLPGKAATPLEAAVYDPDSRMLRGFLDGLRAHLDPDGEGWLVISDLAERLALRAPGELRSMIAAAGLEVAERREAAPRTRGARQADDPLYFARSQEVVSLWRLRPTA